MTGAGPTPPEDVIFELCPFHLARAVFFVSVLPVFYKLAVEGVTVTTEYDLSNGHVSTSDNLASQLGGVAVWIVLAVAAGISEWYLRSKSVEWPAAAREMLVRFRLASTPKND